MTPSAHQIIPLFVAIPLAGAFLTSLVGRRVEAVSDGLGALATLATLVLSLISVHMVNVHGAIVYEVGGWSPPFGIALSLDGLAAFMLVTVNLIAFLVVVFSIDYMEKFTAKWQFYTLFLLMLAGMNGVVVTGDLFNLFVFLEIAAVASYALVAFGTERHELEAAFKYAVMGTLGSLFILLGIVWIYGYTATLNMADMAGYLKSAGPTQITLMAAVLFIMGFGLKAALVPFHAWLPDAHPSAPAPISAMLSGVLIKSLGVYALCRILYNIIGISPALSSILMTLGALSMVIGVFLAIGQWDLKRLLAYHSISQIGYVILGIGIGTPLGMLGGLFHLFNHSVFKSLLFLNSGALEYSTGTRDLQRMGGLAKRLPTTGTTSLFASMSIAGIPPFNGFWSKLIIIVAAVQAGRPWYAFWAALASVLTLASFMKVMKYAFFGEAKRDWSRLREVPLYMQISMGLLAALCLAGGLLLLPEIRGAFLEQAVDVLRGSTETPAIVLGGVQ